MVLTEKAKEYKEGLYAMLEAVWTHAESYAKKDIIFEVDTFTDEFKDYLNFEIEEAE